MVTCQFPTSNLETQLEMKNNAIKFIILTFDLEGDSMIQYKRDLKIILDIHDIKSNEQCVNKLIPTTC